MNDEKRSHHEAFGPPAQDVALATEIAAMGAKPVTQTLVSEPRELPLRRWYTIKSDLTGKYVLDDVYCNDDGVVDFRGAVLAFLDKDEAERRASSMREDHPHLLLRVVPLPASPPDVVMQMRYGDGHPVAAFLHVVRLGQALRVEIRPETLGGSLTLMTLLNMIVMDCANRIAGAQVSPITLLTLGPVAAQVELRDGSPSKEQQSDSEAA